MLRPVSSPRRRLAATTVLGAAIGAALALPAPAQARVFFGFGFPGFYGGFPGYYGGPPAFFYPPPIYAPPPPPVVYAPPPPVAYPAPPATPSNADRRCYAGAYVCPPNRSGPAGSPCSCPTNSGRTRGRIG